MHIALFKHMKTRYFLAFCSLEEVCILLLGDSYLGLTVYYVINCY